VCSETSACLVGHRILYGQDDRIGAIDRIQAPLDGVVVEAPAQRYRAHDDRPARCERVRRLDRLRLRLKGLHEETSSNACT